MPISNILHCEGVPDGPCSMNASGDIVQLCQGDLVLCPYCKEVRFPSNIATQTDVISSMPSSVNTRRKNNDHKLILNPLLAYVISSMHSGSNDNIKKFSVYEYYYYCSDYRIRNKNKHDF